MSCLSSIESVIVNKCLFEVYMPIADYSFLFKINHSHIEILQDS